MEELLIKVLTLMKL